MKLLLKNEMEQLKDLIDIMIIHVATLKIYIQLCKNIEYKNFIYFVMFNRLIQSVCNSDI